MLGSTVRARRARHSRRPRRLPQTISTAPPGGIATELVIGSYITRKTDVTNPLRTAGLRCEATNTLGSRPSSSEPLNPTREVPPSPPQHFRQAVLASKLVRMVGAEGPRTSVGGAAASFDPKALTNTCPRQIYLACGESLLPPSVIARFRPQLSHILVSTADPATQTITRGHRTPLL